MRTYTPKVLREDVEPNKPTTIMYGIGEEHKPNEFGMWHGPNPNLEEMLEVVGKSDKSCIIRFNVNGSDDVIWRWRNDSWEEENVKN